MDLSTGIDMATLLVAVVGVVWGLVELTQSRRQQRLELGNLYIQRFWQIDDDLLRFSKGSADHRQARHRYLRLCEDEFEAAANNWLDQQQSAVWHGWIATESQRVLLIDDLQTCDPESTRFEHIRSCLARPSNHSWPECEEDIRRY